MAENESYVTKTNPSAEDWLTYNNDLFTSLKGGFPELAPQYAPFVDVDRHAAEAEVSVEEYFNQIRERVGPLGQAALRLVQSEMDDAWHITIEPVKEVQDL